MVHRWGISVGFGNLHAFLWAVMWRGKPTPQLRTEAIGGFIATLPLRHVQSERREGQRKSYSLEASSDEHTSELPSLIRSKYAVFCFKKKNADRIHTTCWEEHH